MIFFVKIKKGSFKAFINLSIFSLFFPFTSSADVKVARSKDLKPDQIEKAAVYFNAGVTDETVSWLMQALEELKENYTKIQTIDLFINSEGGSMYAGLEAYNFIKNFPVKINTINSGMTASAATMFYCSSENRYTMPMTHFIMHPAAQRNIQSYYVKPDEAKRYIEDDNAVNKMFTKIYSQCTNLPAQDLERITSSESERLLLDSKGAISLGLVNRGSYRIQKYNISYFISLPAK